jgi:beta-galactosidase beta subunit
MIPGTFVLFLPGELHRPKILDGQNADVRKLVFKIQARQLGL